MFISRQTYNNGIVITTKSMVECVKFLLSSGVKYVLTERFSKDPLENYFGQQRALNRRKDNPSLCDFGYADNSIRNMKPVISITGSNVSQGISTDDNTPVPCRKRVKKCDKLTL